MPISAFADFVTSKLENLGFPAEAADQLAVLNLEEFGIDPQMLDGLSVQDVSALLAEHGVDVTGLDASDVLTQISSLTDR